MRIYDSAYELMSEMGRDLWEMGISVKPKTYQNKNIEGDEDFETKEIICEQYCLTNLPDPEVLFAYTKSHDWAEAEFNERVGITLENPGEAYKLRPDMWEQFLVNGRFDYSYGERMGQHVTYKGEEHSLIYAIAKQLKADQDTRKAILPIFGSFLRTGYQCTENLERDIDRLDGSARIPCSMYYDFLIRNGKLNICYHQRSSDFIQHFGNDVYLAWQLMKYMVDLVNSLKTEEEDCIEPGYLYHTIDSLHVYKKDWVKIKSSIDNYI